MLFIWLFIVTSTKHYKLIIHRLPLYHSYEEARMSMNQANYANISYYVLRQD